MKKLAGSDFEGAREKVNCLQIRIEDKCHFGATRVTIK